MNNNPGHIGEKANKQFAIAFCLHYIRCLILSSLNSLEIYVVLGLNLPDIALQNCNLGRKPTAICLRSLRCDLAEVYVCKVRFCALFYFPLALLMSFVSHNLFQFSTVRYQGMQNKCTELNLGNIKVQ